jgi:hypothetical protein
MQEMKDMMLRQNEAVIQQQIAHADVERREIELSVQRLPAGSDNDLRATSPQLRGSDQSRRELLHELGIQQAANQTFIKVCEEAPFPNCLSADRAENQRCQSDKQQLGSHRVHQHLWRRINDRTGHLGHQR